MGLALLALASFSLKADVPSKQQMTSQEESAEVIYAKQTVHPDRYETIAKINQYIRFHYYKPKAAGLIIGFHQWPDFDTQERLLDVLTQEGLVKVKNIDEHWETEDKGEGNGINWKLWLLEWPELKYTTQAREVCKKLPQIPQLKHCEPDGQSLLGLNVIDQVVLPEEERDVIHVCQSPIGTVQEVKEACELYSKSHDVILTNPKQNCQAPNCDPDLPLTTIEPEQLLELYVPN